MTRTEPFIFVCTCALFAAGFLVPWWPFAALGVLLAAVSGLWPTAFLLALVLDLAYGAPIGVLSWLMFPFALFTLLVVLCRVVVMHYMRRTRVY